jgi:hypothetical protein
MHVFFLNYSVQDFSALYASLFFSVLLGILYDKTKKSGAVPVRRLQAGLVLAVLLMIAQYEVMNYLPLKNDSVFYYFNTALNIKNFTQKDELLFTTNTEVDPQIIYYCQRNIRYAKDEAEAEAFAASRGIKKWEIISFHDENGIPKMHFETYSK